MFWDPVGFRKQLYKMDREETKSGTNIEKQTG